MMHFLSNHGQFRPPFRRRTMATLLDIVIIGLLFLCWQTELVSALYLQQPMNLNNQQQAVGPANQVPDSGAIMQALSQYAAQQMASGGFNGGVQVMATSSPTGGISISNNNNNQQVALVNNVNASNQTMVGSLAGGASMGQQQQVGNQFVIKFIHNDPKSGLAYVSILPANYNNTHEPRIELRYQSKYPWVSLPECSANNTVVAGVIVNDEDQGPAGETSLAIEHGNELGHFKLVSTGLTNTIQVNGPLSRREKAEYNLTIVARDQGSPPKASSSTLVIKLHNPMQGFTFGCTQASPPAQLTLGVGTDTSHQKPVTDLMYVGTMLVIMFSAFIILIIIVCALIQRPSQKVAKPHKGGPPTRTTSATNSRIIPASDQCSAYCLNSGYGLSNMNIH